MVVLNTVFFTGQSTWWGFMDNDLDVETDEPRREKQGSCIKSCFILALFQLL